MSVSLLCPTRRRPASARRFFDSALDAASGPVEVVWYVDDDDEPPETGTLVQGPRIALSDCWNRCAEVASGDILGLMGDDIVFRTPGWDGLVVEAFETVPDRILYVHGRDGIHDGALGTHGFLHRRWVEAVGRFGPSGFSCDWIDTWLTDVADALGRRCYLPALYTEHLHPAVGKAPADDTHRERMERGQHDDVASLYLQRQSERTREVQVLRTLMESA